MKFEEALYYFNMEITKEYGPNCELTKLAVNPNLMGAILMVEQESRRYGLSIQGLSEFSLLGIPIVVREKETF